MHTATYPPPPEWLDNGPLCLLATSSQVVCEQGAPGGCLVVVASGRLVASDAGSSECRERGPGASLGGHELFHGATWSCTAVAVEETVVVRVGLPPPTHADRSPSLGSPLNGRIREWGLTVCRRADYATPR